MAARLPWILAALALGLAALGVALWGDGARTAPAAREEARGAAATPGVTTLVAVDALDSDGAAVDARAPAADGGPVAAELEAFDTVESGGDGLLVRGTVSGVDAERVELELSRVGWTIRFAMRAACDAEGRYEFDATELLDASMVGTDGTQLELVVRHPECLVERRRIALQHGVTPEHGPNLVYVQLGEGTTVCEVDVELRPAGLVRVALAGVENPLEFSVVAAELRDGRPVPPWAAHAAPSGRGEFHLRLAPEASYLVVAAADDQRPTATRIDLAAPGPRELVLHPERGEVLAGRLHLAPELAERELGVQLQPVLRDGERPPEPWPRPAATFDELVWLDGAFEWRMRSGRTHDGGRFTFRGLAPREYELRALGVGVPGEELRAFPAARLRAPAADVALGPLLASLDLDLGPAPEGPVTFELADEAQNNTLRLGPYRTDGEGLAVVHLPPGRDYRVLVGGVEVGTVSTPAAGASARFALAR